MDNKQLLIDYLGIKDVYYDVKNEELAIDEKANENEFLHQFFIMLDMYEYVYFEDGIMVSFNKCLAQDFSHKFDCFKILYDLSIKYKYTNITKYIASFLTSYQSSLSSITYEQDDRFNNMNAAFNSVFDKKHFFGTGKFLQASLMYFNEYVIKNSEDEILDLFDRFLPMLYKRAKNNPLYNRSFDELIKTEKYQLRLIEYDYDILKHKTIYSSALIRTISNNNLINTYTTLKCTEYLKGFQKNNILDEDIIKYIINTLLKTVNQIIKSTKNDTYNKISISSDVENIIESFKIIKNLNINSYMNVINQCITNILFCKRYILKRETDSFMWRVATDKIMIPDEDHRAVLNHLDENIITLYSHLKKDFDYELENCLEIHSKHFLSTYFPPIYIDSNLGLYHKSEYIKKNKFSEYFNELGGTKVGLNKDNLRLYNDGDFYELLLRHLSNIATLSAQIVCLGDEQFIKEKIFQYIESDVYTENANCCREEYIICCKLIITIEQLIKDNLDKIAKPFHKDNMTENLEILFEEYKNMDLFKNGIIFVYYYLYCENGMHYRNDIMHGNIFGCADLSIPLMYIFSSFTILAFMVNYNENG